MHKDVVGRLFLFYLLLILVLPSVSSVDPEHPTDEDTILIQTIITSYLFEEPQIIEQQLEEVVYNEIVIKNLSSFSNPGEPCLPVKGAYVLLPPDAIITDVTVEYDKQITLAATHAVLPGSTPIPVTSTQSPRIPEPDSVIYSSNKSFPAELFTQLGVYTLRGYQIAVFRLHPVQYNPVENMLQYYPEIKLKITVETTNQSSDLYRGTALDRNLVVSKVDNAWMADHWYKPSPVKMTDPYDLLILTVEEFADAFVPLKEAHEQRGLRTEIKTLKDISLIPGQISPEDVRSFIRHEYKESGIEYVLLGGDADIIPARMLYVYGKDEERWPMETTLPADFYFGCLDGEFNGDGDDKWGEPTDGENGGDVDLFAEVYVGRACIDDTTELSNFVRKTLAYENPLSSQSGFPCFGRQSR